MISILTLQSVCVSRNYFDSLTKFILDLYLASLDASAKLFFFMPAHGTCTCLFLIQISY